MAYSPISNRCGPHWTKEEFEAKMREIYEKRKRRHELFHKLWTKAVGTPGYNKQEWLEFEEILNERERKEALV